MNVVPRLSIGLPVYNGQDFLPQSLDALLGQSYRDFELIISDNASTDGTEEICRRYAAQDDRIRYLRQPRNVGISENHNVLVRLANGELFKWVGHDDLFGRDLLGRCVELLDDNPEAVLATSWTALIDDTDRVIEVITRYPLASDSPLAAERFRGLLYAVTGDDDYGVIRIEALRATRLLGSYYHADRALVLELALHGKFLRIPEPLYLRRDLPDRASRSSADRHLHAVRDWCVKHDPHRADRLRHPTTRLLAEYLWAFGDAIRQAPISAAEKAACCSELASYLIRRVLHTTPPDAVEPVKPFDVSIVDVAELVPSRKRSSG